MRLSRDFRTVVLYLVFFAGVAAVWSLLSPAPDVTRPVPAFFQKPLLHLGPAPVTLAFLVKFVLSLGVLVAFARIVRNLLGKWLLARTTLDEGQRYAFAGVTSYVIYAFGIIIGLQTAGLDLSSLAVIGGALGIGIGFGMQNIANNFISGLILLIEHPIKVGDRIEVGELSGDVVRIGARSTWVRTNDNIMIVVPNSEFTTSRVTNFTADDRRVRFGVPVGVSYKSDPEQVREVLLQVARANPDVLAEPSPDVVFLGFGDSALNFELRVWTVKQTRTPGILRSYLYFAIFATFRTRGIEIPFPQRDLHLRSAEASVPVDLRQNPS